MSATRRGGATTWNFGDVDYYFLTGRRRVLDTIAVSTDFLIRQSPMQPGGFTLDRQTSLPYRHVAYMYEAIGDERAVAELYPEAFVAEKYPHRNDSIGFKRSLEIIETMKRVTEHLENLFKTEAALKVPFMISYAPEGLYRYWRLTGDESAREGLVASADFLYTHPDNVMPSGVLRYTGDVRHALGRNPSQYWLVWFDEVDLPGARVYQATEDRRYLNYLTAALDWRLLLKGIADYRYGFGSTLPSTLWLMREGGMNEQHLRSPRTDIDYTKALEIMKPVALQQLAQSGSVPSSYHSLAAEVGRILVITGRPEDAIEWLEPWRTLAIGRRLAMVESVIKRAEEEIEASR